MFGWDGKLYVVGCSVSYRETDFIITWVVRTHGEEDPFDGKGNGLESRPRLHFKSK